MGKGHSVQSNEQEANFNQELQNDLGTEGKVPDGPLTPPEDIKMRLGNAAVLPFLPGDAVSPGQQSLFTSSVLGNLPSDPLGLVPITHISFCCHRDLVAQRPSC